MEGDIVNEEMMASADELPKVSTTWLRDGVFLEVDGYTGKTREIVIAREYDGAGEPPAPGNRVEEKVAASAPKKAPIQKASILKRFASRGRK